MGKCMDGKVPMFLLLVKPPLPHKMLTITLFRVFKGGDARGLPILKGFLHNCGRAGILPKQI